jgi:hypothetical protein
MIPPFYLDIFFFSAILLWLPGLARRIQARKWTRQQGRLTVEGFPRAWYSIWRYKYVYNNNEYTGRDIIEYPIFIQRQGPRCKTGDNIEIIVNPRLPKESLIYHPKKISNDTSIMLTLASVLAVYNLYWFFRLGHIW